MKPVPILLPARYAARIIVSGFHSLLVEKGRRS
jgi:hypothetical protein